MGFNSGFKGLTESVQGTLCWWIERSPNTISYQKFELFTTVLLNIQVCGYMVQWWWMSCSGWVASLLNVLCFLKTSWTSPPQWQSTISQKTWIYRTLFKLV